MAEKKITKREKFGMLRTLAENEGNDMLIEFCDSEISLLDRKASRVDTAKNEGHDKIMGAIKSVLYNATSPMQCGTIADEVTAYLNEKVSLNKASAMLRKMCPPDDKNPNGTGEVIKSVVKGVTYFTLA